MTGENRYARRRIWDHSIPLFKVGVYSLVGSYPDLVTIRDLLAITHTSDIFFLA